MKSMLNYVSLDEMMVDSGNAQFFDDVAEGLHDRAIYDYIKKNVMDLHPSALTGLLDEDLSVFIASAGLIVANADEQVSEKEIDHIIQSLAALQIFPKHFLDSVAKSDVPKLFEMSVANILSHDPGMRDGLLTYMINLVLSDKEIDQKEIEFVYGFGKNIGFSEKEISVKFAEIIQRKYVPSLAAIC